MYNPRHFREDRIPVLHDLMQRHSFATLVTVASEGLLANHVPMLLDPEPAPFGTLRFHVSRANSVWRDFSRDIPALAIFTGPDAYISPSWYPSRVETGKVVPTWNYAIVHAHGSLNVFDNPEWLRAHVTALTARHESAFPLPWQPSDAPADYINAMLNGIVGLEMNIARLEGKWKAGQNRTPVDRAAAAHRLSAGDEESQAVAQLMRDSGPPSS